jgi:7,8-dihydropterin-6-yl-methyl-4-(beta-D-ribofuranosyl)aminobenzene 5'-phosphate synthase
MQYSDKVLEHFMNPRNAGEITDADGVGTIGSEECGDVIRVWIKVSEDEHLSEIKYKVFGCPAAIACCSMMTELAMGKHLDDAGDLTDEQVADALGGLPAFKYHCSNLAASALHEAIMNYVLKSSAPPKTITITTLVDNTTADKLQSEHGLSLWIEFGDKRVLFDTGQSDMIIRNAELLGINLTGADTIVISHGHYDHTGGLKAVLDIAAHATLYLHPKALKPKYSQKDKKIRMNGMPDSAMEAINFLADSGRVVWTEMPTEIYPGLFVTSQIPRNTNFEGYGGNFFINQSCQKPDEFLDDQALFLESAEGLIVVFGCAHSGVVNTLNYVTKLTGRDHIFAVIGGMHLVNASKDKLERTIDAFKRYGIEKIVPCHCTGIKAIEKFKKVFPDRCFICPVGTRIDL